MKPTNQNRQDYEQLVRRYAPSLFRYAYRLTSDRQAAEDLVQETFEQAWQGLRRLIRADSPQAWMFKILKRRYGRWLKRHNRTSRFESSTMANGEPTTNLIGLAHVSRELERIETTDAVQAALARLDDRYKQPLLLVFMEGLSVADAAKALGIRRGTVLSRMHRGRQQLKQWLEADANRTLPAARRQMKSATSKPLVVRRFKRA